jgi:hypothetical protein
VVGLPAHVERVRSEFTHPLRDLLAVGVRLKWPRSTEVAE